MSAQNIYPIRVIYF